MGMENGFMMWNFLGRELYVQKIEGCQVFKWRLRPPSKLTQKQIKHIKANMIQYAKDFQERDHLRSTQVGQKEQEKINILLNSWINTKERYARIAEQQAQYERVIYGAAGDDDEWEEVQVNQILSTKTTEKGKSQ